MVVPNTSPQSCKEGIWVVWFVHHPLLNSRFFSIHFSGIEGESDGGGRVVLCVLHKKWKEKVRKRGVGRPAAAAVKFLMDLRLGVPIAAVYGMFSTLLYRARERERNSFGAWSFWKPSGVPPFWLLLPSLFLYGFAPSFDTLLNIKEFVKRWL